MTNETKGVLIQVRETLEDIAGEGVTSQDRQDMGADALAKLDAFIECVPDDVEYAVKSCRVDEELPFIVWKSDKAMQYKNAYALISAASQLSKAVEEE